jgi:hypothetical protein
MDRFTDVIVVSSYLNNKKSELHERYIPTKIMWINFDLTKEVC